MTPLDQGSPFLSQGPTSPFDLLIQPLIQGQYVQIDTFLSTFTAVTYFLVFLFASYSLGAETFSTLTLLKLGVALLAL